jgi:hypothetical protein
MFKLAQVMLSLFPITLLCTGPTLVGGPDISDVSGVRILLVSSAVRDGEVLAGAAGEDVLVVRYEARSSSLNDLAAAVRTALSGRKAASIGLVTHDHGAGRFYLAGSHSICLASTLINKEERAFWRELGGMITVGGRIDIFACDLAATDQGWVLLAALKDVAGVGVAASSNPTGNPSAGGDWVLEAGGIDLAATYFDRKLPAGFSGLLDAYEKKITSSDLEADDWFGYSVAISGDYAIVGARGDDDAGDSSGSAYIFYKDQGGAGNWGQVTKLTASDAAAGDDFGGAVAISGDYAIVGAYYDDDDGNDSGSAYIFYKNQGGTDNWGQLKKLKPSDGATDKIFGWSVAISGDYAVVGAKYDSDGGSAAGAAYIFYKDQDGADNWGQLKKLTASDAAASDLFGWSVAISGDYVVVGAFYDDDAGANSGSAYIFYKNKDGANNWGQLKKLTASDAAAGDNFGCSAAISGDYAVVGAKNDDDDGSESGSAYIFYKDQGGADNWGQLKKLTASDAAASDYFGRSVSISGDYAVVGAYNDDDAGSDSGSAYIFDKDQGGANNWGQVTKLTADDAATEDYFGGSVSISGDYAVVGAYDDDDAGERSGSAYIYLGTPYIGSPTATDITSKTATLGGTVYYGWTVTPTASGVVWSTSSDPTVSAHTGTALNSGGEGVFNVSATGLAPNTTYHYRAYVTSSLGTSYTDDATFATTGGGGVTTGSLQVTLTPSGACDAGAAWKLSGGSTWRASGYTATDLAAGQYTVIFKPISGWNTPASQTATIQSGGLTTLAAEYTKATGKLKINFAIDTAIQEGVRWRIKNTSTSAPKDENYKWRKDGEVISIAPGTYTIEFLPVPGWVHPDLKVVVAAGKTEKLEVTGVPFLISGCTDFDGDGRGDIACFDTVTRLWSVKGQFERTFGTKGVWPVAGDYDGDGSADLAYWNPRKGLWRVQGQYRLKDFGSECDLPVPGDYDGDGLCDPALYRRSTGEWLIMLSGDATAPGKKNITIITLGGAGDDIPVPGDYDGDGATEAAVYNLGTKTWSIYGADAVKYGRDGELPMPGDYNGDGTLDLALVNLETGSWRAKGLFDLTMDSKTGDFPVLLDYDGDGIPEVGCYCFKKGCWYLYFTALGTSSDGEENGVQIKFGGETTLPLTRR